MNPAEWSDWLTQVLEQRALWQALLVFCAAYVVGTLFMLPAWIFPIAAGAAFGLFWGTAVSVVSAAIASQAAFLLTRYVVRGRVERAAKKSETFAAVDKAVKKEPFKVVALLRLSPVLPSGLKSYFLGLTCVRPMPYALASSLGMLPGVALKAWVGSAGRDVLADGGPTKWAVLGLGLAATIGLTWVISRMARRRLGF
jgi:uncharacterized membrane protein YdjX (TVP38/TMEM64 family)